MLSLLTALVLLITNNVWAQITISQSDLQALVGQTFDIKTFTSDTASDFTNLVTQTGTNQTYDFSTITSFNQTYSGKIQYISLPASIPGSNSTDFQKANVAVSINLAGIGQASDSTAWIYEQLKSDSLNFAGIVFVSQSDLNNDGVSPDTLTIAYKPYLLNAKLPLTYQSTWKDTSSYVVTLGTSSITRTAYTEVTVDGYGTIKTPNNTAQCLRLKRTTKLSTNVGGIISSTTTGSIDFITKSGSTIAASINLDANGNPVSAQYSEIGTSTPIEPPITETIVKNYKLKQNYPNPFNPTTIISYDLVKAGNVKLEIYNDIGRKVATLVNGMQSAGSHEVTFNASHLNSGLYFYKLDSQNFSQTKKMMLVK